MSLLGRLVALLAVRGCWSVHNGALNQLGLECGTDKASNIHDFLDFYEEGLPRNISRLLEVGIKDGRSICVWSAYYKDATVHGWHGWDLSEQRLLDVTRMSGLEGTVTRRVDQLETGDGPLTVAAAGAEQPGPYDIVVDDGLHSTKSMWNTLVSLWPYVMPGGIFIMEDLHACLHFHGGHHGSLCDQEHRTQPTMFELLVALNHDKEGALRLIERAKVPGDWTSLAEELQGVEFHMSPAGCVSATSAGFAKVLRQWGVDDDASEQYTDKIIERKVGCHHATSILTKKQQ